MNKGIEKHLSSQSLNNDLKLYRKWAIKSLEQAENTYEKRLFDLIPIKLLEIISEKKSFFGNFVKVFEFLAKKKPK